MVEDRDIEKQVIKISRKRLMEVLDKNFVEGGIKITVRRYNKILTDLGYKLMSGG